MNEYEVYEANLNQVCKEIKTLTEQIQKNGTASEQDYKRLDLLYHLKKDILACHGMEHPEEFEEGSSGMRGRSPMTGRYVSRDQGSYDNGYNNGYSQAMREMNQNGGNSGHMPMNPYYPEQRHW